MIYNVFDQSPEDELFPACREHGRRRDRARAARRGRADRHVGPDTDFPEGDLRASYFRGDRKRELHDARAGDRGGPRHLRARAAGDRAALRAQRADASPPSSRACARCATSSATWRCRTAAACRGLAREAAGPSLGAQLLQLNRVVAHVVEHRPATDLDAPVAERPGADTRSAALANLELARKARAEHAPRRSRWPRPRRCRSAPETRARGRCRPARRARPTRRCGRGRPADRSAPRRQPANPAAATRTPAPIPGGAATKEAPSS